MELYDLNPVTEKNERFLHFEQDDNYLPGLWDLGRNPVMLKHWQGIFRSNFTYMMKLFRMYRDRGTVSRGKTAREEMNTFLDRLESRNLTRQFPTVHHITIFRENLLQNHGLEDPYREEKLQATKKALSLYPRIIRKLDGIADFKNKMKECCYRVFGGNTVDLGSVEISRQLSRKSLQYSDIMKRVRRKKWFLDHFDVWMEKLSNTAHTGSPILFFVDNAGHDFVCGCIPMARTLAETGFTVLLITNETPSLNDVTFEEALVIFNRLQTLDTTLRSMKDRTRIRIISNGNRVPGIDFRYVGGLVNMDSRKSAMMILEGQGRAIETNWKTRFGIDCVRISTVKERTVADAIDASPLDLILRFDRCSRGQTVGK